MVCCAFLAGIITVIALDCVNVTKLSSPSKFFNTVYAARLMIQGLWIYIQANELFMYW